MIRHQLVQWILIPNGLTRDGQLAASLFISPRLRPGEPATLADFPDFMDWPAVLNNMEFQLERADGSTENPRHVVRMASSGWWQALFPASTAVRAFEFNDLADRPIVSYPVLKVLDYLKDGWATLAHDARDDLPISSKNASPIGPPLSLGGHEQRLTLATRFEDLRDAIRQGIFEGELSGQDLSDRLRNALDSATSEARRRREQHNGQPTDLIEPFGPATSTADAFYALNGFHARPSRKATPAPGDNWAVPKAFPATREDAKREIEEQQDFHYHLTTLGSHPTLLRHLGLAIDLEIRPDFVPFTNASDPATLLRVRIQRPSSFPARSDDPAADTWNVDVTPWTSCRLTDFEGNALFNVTERTSRLDFTHGFLNLDPERYIPVTVDVDGLALKALDMAATLERQDQEEQRPVEEPARDGVPSARTSGIAIVHTGHATELHEDFEQTRANNEALEQDPDNPPVLAAEDLVRGYRLDIWSDGAWRSLHRRQMTYVPERSPDERLDTEDEGYVELSLTSEVDRPDDPADPDRPLYAHEALTTWDGWSLSVARPGQPIPQEPAVPEAGTDIGSMRLSIAASPVPQSLPRLRFQSEYRVRVRTVNLAGTSHDGPTADHLTLFFDGSGLPAYRCAAPAEPLRYARFEPVPPPDLLPRFPFSPGESLERLVIRSAPGQSVDAYAQASQSASDPMLRFRAFGDRHIVAAKASLQLVETHGLLDKAIDAVRDRDLDAAAAAAQSFYELATRESGSFRHHPDAHFVPTEDPDEQQPGDEPEGYVCIDADTLDLPYLPDPLGVGAKIRLRLRPGEPEEVMDIRFEDGGGWERPLPFRLRLEEGEFTSSYSAPDRLLTVGIPAGRTAELRMSSLFDSDPDIFGIMAWCREKLDAAKADEVYGAIQASTHWMTTPWRDMILVHAVQQPLEPAELELDLESVPGFAGMQALARPRGATAADLTGRFFFDLPSTGQLDVSASWDEVTDDPLRSHTSEDEMHHAASTDVFSLVVPEPFGTPWIPEVAPLIEPLDERTINFTTRGWERQTPEQIRLQLLDDASAPNLPVQERRRLQAGAAQLERLRAHEFGDTRYRRVTYHPTAATRFREYFDPRMRSQDGISAGTDVTVDVLSSARPAKPDILQVLPLMDYSQDQTGEGGVTSTRTGLGLRVWLRRPWFSSGAGELLALVCGKGGPMSPSSELSRELTALVADPSHGSSLPHPLMTTSFPSAEMTVESVPLSGPDQRADIAAFRPVWDVKRQAWYCDIEIPTGTAYFPFVRLGLARYQPSSIPGCELSPIVPTAFVQTVPNRTLTVIQQQDGQARITLTGPAPSSYVNVQGATVSGTNVVVAVVEEQDAMIEDPFLGWTGTGPESELASTLQDDHTATWSGMVPLPEADGRRLRIAVREYEIHPADDRSASPAPSLVAARRLVYADTVPM